MPTPITPVPTWDTPLTNAGADIPNSANMLAVLQTHADRAEFLNELRLRTGLQLRPIAITNPPQVHGVGVHERSGQVVLFGETTFARVSLGYPSAVAAAIPGATYREGATLPGTPTISGNVPSAYNGTTLLIFVSGGYDYVFPASNDGEARHAFTNITDAADIIWSPYFGRFLATGNGEIESSVIGGAWTVEMTSSYDFCKLACDVTGQYVLAAPNASDDWAYSSDGGDTWTVIANKTIGGDNAYTVTGLAYDDSRGLWLATFDGATFAGDATRVWTVADPVAGTWAVSGAAVPVYGLEEGDSAYARGVICMEDAWIVGAQGVTSDSNVWVTRDAGATWEMPVSFGSGTAYPVELRRVGSYVAFGRYQSAPLTEWEAISGRLWT